MIGILSTKHDPYYNLAAEELLLRHRDQDYFFLYRNRPSVVVGKHQNALAEINLNYVNEHGLIVARRISGGGTVFHDLGNLNWGFITSGREGELVDYARHAGPVIAALGSMGLEVRLGKRNELLLGKHKISGTASHVYKSRVLHHGTLLYSSQLDALDGALLVDEGRFTDRAVRSVPSRVCNIRPRLAKNPDVGDFEQQFFQKIMKHSNAEKASEFSPQDEKEIEALKKEKFSTWEWNFGYSPKYQFSRQLVFDGGQLELHMNVEKGIIQEIEFRGSFEGMKDIHGLEDVLLGTIHDPETLRQRISGIQVGEYITGLENEKLLSAMF